MTEMIELSKKLVLPIIASASLVGCVTFQSDSTTSTPTTADGADRTTADSPPNTAADKKGSERRASGDPTDPSTDDPPVSSTDDPPVSSTEPAPAPEETAPSPSDDHTTSGIEVITAVGVGERLQDPEVSTERRFTDNPVADYLYYGGDPNLPFLNIENGLLVGASTSVGKYSNAEYNFAVGHSTQSPEEIAKAAVAPLQQRYPGASISNATTESENTATFAINLNPTDQNDPDWIVAAAIDSTRPGMAIVKVKMSGVSDPATVGEVVMPPCCSSDISAFLDETGLPQDEIDFRQVVNGSLLWTGDGQSFGLHFSIPNDSSTEWVDRLRPLTEQGWELNDENSDYAVFLRDADSIQVFHNDADDPVVIYSSVFLDV